MEEKIDSRTVYGFEVAEISHWETNIPCREFYTFPKVMITQMLSGTKEIYFGNDYVRFPPNSVFLPPTNIEMMVDIHEASAFKPVECITLDVSDEYVQKFYYQLCNEHKIDWEQLNIGNNIQGLQYFSEDDYLCSSFKKLYDNRKEAQASKNQQFLLSLNLKELLFLLLQTNARSILIENRSESSSHWLFEVVQYIKENFRTEIKVNTLAKIACKSESIFYKSFKEHLGCTPNQYIILERIKYAKEKLTVTNEPIQILAFECGFNSAEHFSRKFKDVVGETPQSYRKRN